MEIRKILFRKEMKLVTLLLTSMLIASVSAATYYSLTMTSTVSVYASNVYFKVGTDNGAKGLVVTLGSDNTTVTLSGLRAYPNATFTYTDPVKVRNNATSGSAPSIRLAPSSDPSGNADDFEFVKFLLNATAVGDRRWLNYTSNGATWSNTGATSWVSLPNNTEWSIVVMTKALTTGVAGQTVTIVFTVDVD
jgi:hypothetical protein